MKHSHVRFGRRMAGFLATMVLAGIAGYRLHDYQRNSNSVTKIGAPWDLDYFTHPESFSEIEASRTDMEGLAARYRTEIRTRYLYAADSAQPVARRRSSVIAELERGVEEFRNTPGEPLVLQDLLLLLKQAGEYDRWLTVYLDMLYRRPTEEIIGILAREAQELGTAVGRAAEVDAALRHVLEIPREFPSKQHLRGRPFHVTSLPSVSLTQATL